MKKITNFVETCNLVGYVKYEKDRCCADYYEKFMIKWYLKRIIEQQGISGKELAHKLDVHPNTVSRLRNTKEDKMPHIDGDLLDNLCEKLNCSPVDLIEYIPSGQTSKDIPKKVELNKNLEQSAQITNELIKIVDSLVDGIPSDKLVSVTTEIMTAVIAILVPMSD